MARIFQTGFELGTTTIFDVQQAGTATASTVRNGAYALQSQGSASPILSLDTTYSTVYVRLGFRTGSLASTTNVFAFLDGASLQGRLAVTGGGAIQVFRGNTSLAVSANNLIAINNWHLIEAFYDCATSGTWTVKVDGTQVLTDADDTDETGSGTFDRFSPLYNGNGTGQYVDDIAINDTTGSNNNSWIGDGKCVLVKPNANVSGEKDFTGVGDVTDTWKNVDDVPTLDDGTYNYSTDATDAAGSDKDLFDVDGSAVANVETVNAVQVWYRAQKDAATSDVSLRSFVKGGTGAGAPATEANGTENQLTQSWAWYQDVYETNPDTTSLWTDQEVEAMYVGYQAQGTG